MKKCMNGTDLFVDESLSGILAAYRGFYEIGGEDLRAVIHSSANDNVIIVTGGGYGHLPLFLGYVGDGLCDGVAVGNVFTSPSCKTILNVTYALKPSKGVLYLFGNYFGDTMNFEMACEDLELKGIPSQIVKMSDDAASAPRDMFEERRGIAGILFAYKIAGACAQQGKSLEEVVRITRKTVANTATFGVAFSSCMIPGQDRPIFEMDELDMEIGMGIHGEPGIRRGKMQESACIAQELCHAVTNDLSLKETDRVAVLVNGLGATSREELYIFYRDIERILVKKGLETAKVFVGEYATSMEMSGLSLSLIRLDDELEYYLKEPAYSPLICF
jgi:phosphoenolpyruvate---glycerone phosphotransferase subunit DhaK